MKKIISCLLALAMVLGSGAPLAEGGVTFGTEISASAEQLGDYYYIVLDDGTIEIIGWYGDDKTLNVPSVIAGKKVTSIGGRSFQAARDLTTLTLPDSITNIGEGAFVYCESLKSLTIPKNVTSIGSSAFSGCTSLTSVKLSDKITCIEACTFYECTNLSSITIPADVTSIGNSAFESCESLTKVTIPDKVTDIGNSAFLGCTNLTKVKIPAGVKSIGTWAFDRCPKLKILCYSGSAAEQFAKDYGISYLLIDKHTHAWDGGKVTKAATCTATGTKVYTCTLCDQTKTETIKKLAHKYTTKVVQPTFTAKGYTQHKCSVCGYTYKDKYTAKLSRDVAKSKVTVSKTKAYTGKAIKPSVTVKIGTVKLKKNTDYTVTYKNNKKTGKATITIKGKGKFKGKKNVNFIIVPKKPGTPAAKALGGKKIKVMVKNDKMAAGYQIQVSTSKKFTKSATKTSTLTKTVKTFTKLKKGKKYYVRSRSYVKVGKTKYYGAYSKLKTVKCK